MSCATPHMVIRLNFKLSKHFFPTAGIETFNIMVTWTLKFKSRGQKSAGRTRKGESVQI